MVQGVRPDSDFCWINLVTPDGEGAKRFFSAVFGWTYGEMHGVPGGTLIRVEGAEAGALMDHAASGMPAEVPAFIDVMVRVANADETVAKIRALGGKAHDAFQVLENGRMAVCFDPNGAQFGIWQPLGEVGFDCDSQAHGAPTWFETHTTDVERAVTFYEGVFGWTAVTESMGDFAYTVFLIGDRAIAGLMKRMPHAEHVPPHWGTYFAVGDCDRTAEVAAAHGAEVCIPPMPIPTGGRFALLRSPQGVMFHLMQHPE